MNELSEAGITFPPGSWLSSPPPGVSLDTLQLWGHHVAPCVGLCSEGAPAWVLQLGCPIGCWPPVLPGRGMLEEGGEKHQEELPSDIKQQGAMGCEVRENFATPLSPPLLLAGPRPLSPRTGLTGHPFLRTGGAVTAGQGAGGFSCVPLPRGGLLSLIHSVPA